MPRGTFQLTKVGVSEFFWGVCPLLVLSLFLSWKQAVRVLERYVHSVVQQFTLDKQFVDAAMPSHLKVKHSLVICCKTEELIEDIKRT